MSTELICSISAVVISLAAFVMSGAVEYRKAIREKKQATLDAINVLQEQAFDRINEYTQAEINDIVRTWKKAVIKKDKAVDPEHKAYCIEEYRKLGGYLARIEHFALGVNTGIYDTETAERAATMYLKVLYRSKLSPLIELKNSQGRSDLEYYAEFRKLVEAVEKIEN